MGASWSSTLPSCKPCCRNSQTAGVPDYKGIQSVVVDSARTLYPMYVMKVSDALELKEVIDHQELLAQGKIRVYTEGMQVIFVSHQWLGRAHPDKDFQQFKVLQGNLRNLLNGMKVLLCPVLPFCYGRSESLLTPEICRSLKDAYIWYDFFSVPQVTSKRASDKVQMDLEAAVGSIPAYVNLCKHFFTLVPPATHADHGNTCNQFSWSRRGWCRVELAARAFSLHADVSIYNVVSPTMIVESLPMAWVTCPPRFGDFAVEDDRIKVSELMLQCMRRRAWFLQQKGDIFEFRFMKAMAVHAAENVQIVEDLSAWLSDYEFKSALELGPCGWAPVHFAALEGNIQILDALLREGEKVDRQTTEAKLEFSSEVGMTPLMVASFYISDTPAAIKVAQFLLSRGASLSLTSAMGKQVLHCAAIGAAEVSGLCSVLIEHGALLEEKCTYGMTPMHYSAFN
eukprot:gnl/MRDRNA2_/MRDRNA2_70668_c0_seq1.p1 gnl/MRDRNA2_/MRDRNA2_70668_c0~~gnl/MRDRNA2_/MRDRNA2_70668_c0_seq1.p1  ORF type:complete len:454 (+),score=86.36 gnl/MRDRNA2_/MRDRNA2_70668_c0_seq1:87-1448(+)